MSVGLSKLAGVERLTAWTTKYTYIQYHTADPGPAGTTSIATESTRILVTWDTPDDSVAGVVTVTHTNDLEVSGAAATEDYAYVSHWSASTAGDFGGSGEVTADAVTVGNDFALPAGALIVTQPVAS